MTTKKTNAIRELEKLGIPVEVIAYEVADDFSAVGSSEKVGIPVERIFKTLVLRGDDPKKDLVMACVPGDAELDLKKLAALSGNKKMEMVHVRELPALTGYIRGGCSPIGSRRPIPVYLDESALTHETISVSAGHRGLQMVLTPQDLIRASDATVGDLTKA